MTTLAPRCPSPESLCLPRGYRQQAANLTLDANRDNGSYWSEWRLADSARWQHHVYAWAAELIKAGGVKSVLDVGCGPCTKLRKHILPVCADVHGIDQPSALEIAARLGTRATLTAVDLERPDRGMGRTFDLIICADVVEHLIDPDPALDLIKAASHSSTLILISTPERHRRRGRACMASDKPEHVREWSRDEFAAFLRSRGLKPVRSRLTPRDDAPVVDQRERELRFRLGQAPTSPLCCQAVLSRVAAA